MSFPEVAQVAGDQGLGVPDMRSPALVAEAHRQSQAAAAGTDAADGQAFVDALAESWPA